MATTSSTDCHHKTAPGSTLAKPLSPEDISVGDYVAPLYYHAEVLSFLWRCDSWTQPPEELVRIKCVPTPEASPLKVKSVCVPFVLVKTALGEQKTIDLRSWQLARLDASYAKRAWKAAKKAKTKLSGPAADA